MQSSDSPSTKTIYIIRHGQTDFNQLGIVQGAGIDLDINAFGKQQADAFFQAYKHIPFAHIFVSALKRTHQTIAPFKNIGIPVSTLSELNEINWGILEGKKPNDQSRKEFYTMLKYWRNGELDRAINGGETPMAMAKRQKIGLQKIEAMGETPFLICMHGRALRAFLCLLLNNPLQQMDQFKHENVCLYVLEKHKNDAHYSIILRNNLDHLTHLKH